MSEEVIPPPVKKRVRRPKERPEFYQMDNAPTPSSLVIKDLRAYKNHLNEDATVGEQSLSPYSNLIPVSYLSVRANNLGRADYQITNIERDIKSYPKGTRVFNITKCERFLKELVFDSVDLARGHETILDRLTKSYQITDIRKKAVKQAIEDYFTYDKRAIISSPSIGSNSNNLKHYFEKAGMYTINMRTYGMKVGFFSALLGENPMVMAVVRPEDYFYHKRHILLNGTIDLSRVIILIDRELDLPGENSRIPNGFKLLYRKILEPAIKATNCKIWKVQNSFIKENCFVNTGNLIETKKLSERDEEIAKIMNEFYKDFTKTK